MGRGRAKAKQTKVARQLKYTTINSDLGALQAELSHHPDAAAAPRTGAANSAADDVEDEDRDDEDAED